MDINLAKIKRGLQKNKQVNFISDLDMNLGDEELISAKVKVSQNDSNSFKVRVSLVATATGKMISKRAYRTGTCTNVDILGIKIQNMTNSLRAEVMRPSAGRRRTFCAGDLVNKIKQCDDLYDEYAYQAVIPRKKKWKSSTVNQTATFLTVSLLPRIETAIAKNGDITEADLEEIIEDLYERAVSSKRTGEKGEKKSALSREGVKAKVKRCVIMYDRMRELHPEKGLPKLPFPELVAIRTSRIEQPKSLSDFIRVAVGRLLLRCAELQIPQAFSASLEFFCGHRSSESVAVLNSELIVDDSRAYGSQYIDYQIKNGSRTKELKGKSSHRYVVFGEIMIEIINCNNRFYEEHGIEKSEYKNFSFSAPCAKIDSFITAQSSSAFLLDILQHAGCTEEFVAEMQCDLYNEIDRSNGDVTDQLSAHICRRDYGSRCEESAMDYHDINALLGHEDGEVGRRDYATNDSQRQLAERIDAAFVFDPRRTSNPLYRARKIKSGEEIILGETMGYSCVAEEDVIVSLDLSTLEPGDPLCLTVDGGSRIIQMKERYPRDQLGIRKNRRVHRMAQAEEEIMKAIAYADSVDLSAIIRKYRRRRIE